MKKHIGAALFFILLIPSLAFADITKVIEKLAEKFSIESGTVIPTSFLNPSSGLFHRNTEGEV